MDPAVVEALVAKHINSEFAKLGSPNSVKVTMSHGAKAWLSDFNHPNYIAGRRAVHKVFGVEPDLTREGGSIPITLKFEEATGVTFVVVSGCSSVSVSVSLSLACVSGCV